MLLRFLQAMLLAGMRSQTLSLDMNPRKGERGLAKTKVTVWIYEGSLRVEKEAVTLSQYEIELESDHKHVQAVSNPQTHQTPFRSPQLALFDLGPDGWILYWKKDDQATAPHRHYETSIIQLPLFDLPPSEMAVGAEEGSGTARPRSQLHSVPKQPMWQETEE